MILFYAALKLEGYSFLKNLQNWDPVKLKCLRFLLPFKKMHLVGLRKEKGMH